MTQRIVKFIKETEDFHAKEVEYHAEEDVIEICHAGDSVILDKKQAKELIEILSQFINK